MMATRKKRSNKTTTSKKRRSTTKVKVKGYTVKAHTRKRSKKK